MAGGERPVESRDDVGIEESSDSSRKFVPKNRADLEAMGYTEEQIGDWVTEGLVLDENDLVVSDEYMGFVPMGKIDSDYLSRAHEQNSMEQNLEDRPDLLVDIDNSKDFLSNQFGERVLRATIVNQDADLEAVARFRGENKLGEALNEHKGVRKILDRIWKGGFMRSYYRQKFIQEAREEIKQSGSLMTEYDEKERRRYNASVCELFIDEVADIDTEHGDKRESLKDTNPELLKDISDLVKRYARGDISDIEDANREFADLLAAAKQEGFDKDNFYISNINSVVIEARKRYEDMITIAQATSSRIDHEEALNAVMDGFDLIYGNNQMERRTPSYNRVDRIVDKLKSSKVGCVVPTGTLALAAGAAASITEFVGKRAISSAFVGAFGVSGAISVGLQASMTFEQERARAFYDERYSRKLEGKDKGREKMIKTVYEHHSALDEAKKLEALREEASEIIKNGGDASAKTQELLQAVARCQTYLRMDKEGNSLLKYSSELDAPSEQLVFLQQIVRSKLWLQDENHGDISDLDGQLDAASQMMQDIRADIEKDLGDVDKVAKRQKVEKILRQSGKSLLVGAAVGFAAQEIGALMNPDVQGIFENNDGYASSLTAGRKLANWIRGDTGAKHDELLAHLDITGENAASLTNGRGSNMEFIKSDDGTYALLRDGKEVAHGIDWNAQTGKLTPDSLKILQEQGIEVSKTQDLGFSYTTQVEGSRIDQVSLSEYYKNFGDAATKVKRSFWYDNNSTVFDHNELACYNYTDPVTGAHGFVTRMSDTGSWHGDKVATFSELAKNGEIKLFLSPSGDTQSAPIAVTGKLLSDGQLAFVPEAGSVAEKFFNPDGSLNCRFGEVAQVLGQGDGGETLIAPLATAVGNDYDGLIDVVVPTVEDVVTDGTVPEYLFSVTDPELPWNMPMIFPFLSDGAMKNSQAADANPRNRGGTIRGGGYAGGYGGSSYNSGSSDFSEGNVEAKADGYTALGEISPRIAERKQLNLGQEVSDYRKRMIAAGEAEHASFIDQKIAQSRELSNLDDSTKMVIMVPVWAKEDGDKIYDLLSLYAQQKDVDMGSFMVMLDINDGLKPNDDVVKAEEASKVMTDEERAHFGDRHPTARELAEYRLQQAYRGIEQARRDFPELRISAISHFGREGGAIDASRVMADTVMLAIDKAVKEGRMSANNDILMVRNDADMKHLDSHYVESYQEAARKNPKTPIFTGTTWFNINHQRRVPGLGAVTTVERMNNLFGAVGGHIHTAGGNFGYRAAHFAAVNGYGFAANGDLVTEKVAGADDLRAGWRIANAMDEADWDRAYNSGRPEDGDLMDPQTRMLVRVGKANVDTDNLRYLKFYANDDNSVMEDSYRSRDERPASVHAEGYNDNMSRGSWTEWKDFRENIFDDSDGERNEGGIIKNRQLFNATIEQVEEEFTDFLSIGQSGADDRSGRLRIIDWYMMSPNYGLYTVTEEDDTTNRYYGRKRYVFRFTEAGREQFRKAMIKRILGDGTGNQDVNGHQRSIRSGDWVRRASDVDNNALY